MKLNYAFIKYNLNNHTTVFAHTLKYSSKNEHKY